ncbi:MAG: hypothetical protein ABEH35_04985 [Haloarculaceae archaeon]
MERTDDLTRESADTEASERTTADATDASDRVTVDTPVDEGPPVPDATDDIAPPSETTSRRWRDRLVPDRPRLFSLRSFALSVAATLAGLFVLGGLLPLGPVGRYLGLFLGAMVAALVTDESAYIEAGLAGAVAAGTGTLLNSLVLTLVGIGVPLVAAGAGAGALVALGGHYAGRDLRAGLTRDL